MAYYLRGDATMYYRLAAAGIGLIVIAILAFYIYPCRQHDFILYEELIKSSMPKIEDGTLSHSEQKRKGVRKHIWYQGETPLKIEIESENSELLFLKQARTIEIVEELDRVICLM